MRIRLSTLLLVLFGLCALAPTRVLAQGSPYSTTVPVLDTSDAQRDHAFAVALGQVLGQVAGKDLSSRADYTDALTKAPSYVQQFQYGRAQTGAVAPYTLTVTFDPSAIRRLVGGMGASTWSGPDSPILLLVRDANGMRVDAAALAPLIQAIQARGMRAIVASDTSQTAALARADPQALAAVAQRYHTGLVLLGTLGDGNAVWTLVAAGKVSQWSDRASGADVQLGDAGQTLVARLMQQFTGAGGAGGTGTLWVADIDSGADFAALLNTLRGNSAVDADTVAVQEAAGNGVLLEISTSAPLQSVVSNLAAGGRLLPATAAHAGADASLRWLH